MIRHGLYVLAVVVAALPAQASQLFKKLPVALDPTKAYVLVEIGKLDQAMLDATLILGRYDSAKGDVAAPTPPPGGKVRRGGWRLDNRLHLLKPTVKTKGHRLFVAELDPGLWVIEGANDTSFSLGSSTLQLEPGAVVDLGVASVYSDFPEGEKRDVLTTGRLLKGALVGGLFGSTLPPPMPKAVDFRPRAASDMQLPPQFATSARTAAWAGEVRFGNQIGGLVNRMGGRKARFRALAAENRSDPDKTNMTDQAVTKETAQPGASPTIPTALPVAR